MKKKNKVVIDGIEYYRKSVDEEDKDDTEEDASTEEESTEEESTDEESSEDKEEVDEEALDEVADEAAKKILASIGIGDLKKTVDKIEKTLAAQQAPESKKKALLNLEELMKKDVSEMTAKEKIVGFFQAIISNDRTVLKALSEGVNADGGFLFPDEFRSEIIRDLEDIPHMRGEVTVIPMRRDVMNIPTLVSGPQVTWTAELAAKSTTTAHFGQATLTVYKMAAIMYLSDELIEDSTEIDVVAFIIKLFSEAMGNEEDKVITAGTGSAQPTGFNQATIGSVASETGNLSFDDLINVEYLLPAKYHPGAKFYVHRNNIKELRKIKDTQGRYLWSDPVAAGQPATFHGFPVVENNWLAESEIYFGDLKRAYWLGDRKKMTVKISNDVEQAFTNDQTAVRVVQRIAGIVVLAQALKKITGIA